MTVLYKFVYLDLVGYVVGLCVFMPVWVFVMLFWQLFTKTGVCYLKSEDKLVELVWTLVPTLFVLVLCFLKLQCIGADIYRHAREVVKMVGRQWYWEYDSSDYEGSYDSYMTDYMDSVDKPLRLFFKVSHCLLITSADVIHSFSMPSLGIKLDAMPGRMNQLGYTPDRMGVFVGYCSELCGAGHAYMPIVVEVVKPGLLWSV